MAAVAPSKPVSNIAVAFAAHSAAAHIPIPRNGGHASAMPTPPSSLSPTLPAQKGRPGVPGAVRYPSPLSADIDMDIDLEDAVDHAAAQDQPAPTLSKEALAGLDATRQITALMLAKHHLPNIILGHGAMPIREMMAHLTHSVPGFSGLPPSKARRLVVAALEHRAGGGLHGEVKFEKVGWGRWSVAGTSPSTHRGVPIGAHGARDGLTPPASLDGRAGLHLSKNKFEAYSGSWAADSPDSHDEDMADQMSMDGSEESESESDTTDVDLDMDDETDEEDWSTMGPQSLRQNHKPANPVLRDYNYLSRTSGARFPSISGASVAFSNAGRSPTPGFNPSSYTASRGNTGTLPASVGAMGPRGHLAEREAIEALIAMGSM